MAKNYTSTNWTDEQVQYIKENYLTKSNKQLGEDLGKTQSSICNKIRRLGLTRPDKYTYDRNFFHIIDTEEKAYWLGFMCADGYISQSKDGCEASIELQIGDIDHLKKFNKSLKGNVEIGTRERYLGFKDNRKSYKLYKQCNIRLYSKQIVEDLYNNGCVYNKSDKLKLSKVSDDLFFHYLRGYFDGNGSVLSQTNRKRNYIRFNFTTASYDFITELRETLYNKYNITSYIVQEKIRYEGGIQTYRLNISGLENNYKFGKMLYDNAHIYLDRKYDRYIELSKQFNIENRISNFSNERIEKTRNTFFSHHERKTYS